MKITCDHCRKKIHIPDEKIPAGKSFSIGCPNCKQKVSVQSPAAQAPSSLKKQQPEQTGSSEIVMDNGAPVNPFEFLEEGAKTAMICEPDPGMRSRIRQPMESMEYHILEAENARETLKQMRFHDFDLVVLNELFDTRDPEMNHVLKYLSQLNMTSRRKMFLVLLSAELRTMDKMRAFNKSVNLIVNLNDMAKFDKILGAAMADHDNFYRVFKEFHMKIKGP